MPYLSELVKPNRHVGAEHPKRPDSFVLGSSQDMRWLLPARKRVNLFALGDVGSMLLTGLVLTGGDCIEEIGIYDVRDHVCDRYEFEMNQIRDPAGGRHPHVHILTEEELFDCDVFLFCASLRVPPVSEGGDVRMAQFSANAGLVRKIAGMAAARGYRGLFAQISDPVDPLCRVAVRAGLPPHQVHGFGLGVMAARAAYYAEKNPAAASYLEEGRAYGPHGEDLVIANSIRNYDDSLSRTLTEQAVHSNLVMRGWGFKPYIAPALSSGALSLEAMIRGEWHYSSAFLGEAFLGVRCRCTPEGTVVENPDLPRELYDRIVIAYEHLKNLKG